MPSGEEGGGRAGGMCWGEGAGDDRAARIHRSAPSSPLHHPRPPACLPRRRPRRRCDEASRLFAELERREGQLAAREAALAGREAALAGREADVQGQQAGVVIR